MKVALAVLVIFAFAGATSAIRCYVCSSINSGNACRSDTFDSSHNLVIEANNCNACGTTVTTLSNLNTETRTCHTSQIPCNEVDANGVHINCCTSELCNGRGSGSDSVMHAVSLLSMMVPLLAKLVL